MGAFDNFMVFSFEINNNQQLLFQSKKKESKINMLTCSKIFRKSLHWLQVLLLLLLLLYIYLIDVLTWCQTSRSVAEPTRKFLIKGRSSCKLYIDVLKWMYCLVYVHHSSTNLIKITCFIYLFNFFSCYTLTSNLGIMSGLIFSTDQSAICLLNLKVSKESTRLELLSYWWIYLTVLHMIGRSKMNERLPDVTPNRILLERIFKKINKHLILIRLSIHHLYNYTDLFVDWTFYILI